MASKRQRLKLSKRPATSECTDTKLDYSSSTKDKSFNETLCNIDGDSSFTSNGKQSNIFKKLRQQLQDIHTDVQPVQFSAFPIFKVNNIECSHKETLSDCKPNWTPFPEVCSHCATREHSGITEQLNDGYSGTKSSLQYEACAISQLISHFHQENLNRNQLNWIGKISNLSPGLHQQHSLVDEEKKLDCMLSPDLFACHPSVERKPNANRETSGKSVSKTLFPVHNAQDSSSLGSSSSQQGEVSHQSVTSLIKQCPICQAVFTPQMQLRERNIHIESCLDATDGDIWDADDS